MDFPQGGEEGRLIKSAQTRENLWNSSEQSQCQISPSPSSQYKCMRKTFYLEIN